MELVISNKIRILVDLKCNLSGSQATISPPSKGHLDGVSLAQFYMLTGQEICPICDLSAL